MFIVADNLNITNPVIEKAVSTLDPEPVREMVRACEVAGADAIDINSGPLTRDPQTRMAFLVESVQSATDLPVLIDTANPKAMEAGLGANRKTAIINAFTLEPSRLDSILPMAKTYDTDIIGYLVYPNGHVPPDAADRLDIAVELYTECHKAGLDKERLIIDPIIVPIYWQNGTSQAMEILEVIRTLPDLLGFPVRTMAALSNFTSDGGSKEKKRLLEKAYLPMLMASGLNMVMMNVLNAEITAIARVCRTIAGQRVFAWEG